MAPTPPVSKVFSTHMASLLYASTRRCTPGPDVYKRQDFNITDYRCVLSLRDPADKKKYHDDDAMWNHAESALRERCV